MGLSVVAHILVFLFFILCNASLGDGPQTAPTPYITVDLVSLPETPSDDATGSISLEKSAVSPSSAPVPQYQSKKKAAVYKKPKTLPTPLRPDPPAKKSLKEKTFDPEKTLTETLDRLKQKLKNTSPESVAQALDRLNQQVAAQNKSLQIAEENAQAGWGDKKSSADKQSLEAIDIYKLEIRYRILENWVFPQYAAGTSENLKTVIAIKISAGGKILDMWFDRRSGNNYYDESARKAILKSAPLPPLPPAYAVYTVGLAFTPSALE